MAKLKKGSIVPRKNFEVEKPNSNKSKSEIHIGLPPIKQAAADSLLIKQHGSVKSHCNFWECSVTRKVGTHLTPNHFMNHGYQYKSAKELATLESLTKGSASVERGSCKLQGLPRDIREYALVIQCGGCMITRKQIVNRLRPAIDAGIPVTNYGMAIAYVQGIYPRAIAPFTASAISKADYL